MKNFLPIIHISGAIAVLWLINAFSSGVVRWEMERIKKARRENAALALGVPLEEVDQEKYHSRIVALFTTQYSNERLSNRISDLCFVIRCAWGWLGFLIMVAVLGGAIFSTAFGGSESAVIAWLAVLVQLFFWGSSIAFSWVCRLVTGRNPGEAKAMRKFLLNSASAQKNQL